MTYREACDFLFGLPSWSTSGAYRPGLDRIRALLDLLDRPDRRYPIVHAAGTNGKGSVCAMIAAMATAGGHRVGLHTSPHLFSFTERMRVDGRAADEVWIAKSTEALSDAIVDVGATFFEASTAIALHFFAEQKVELAVVEVGMGGRLDATNIVTPVLSVITSIGLDHTEHLGTTLAAIATEKAGIIKPGVPVVSGCNPPEAAGVIRAAADRARSKLVDTCDRDPADVLRGITLDFGGSHQIENAMVALVAAEVLGATAPAIRMDRRGLEQTRKLAGLRGRSEILTRAPTIVADVAHNVDGIQAALRFTREVAGSVAPLDVLIGLSRDKDIAAIMTKLSEFDVRLHLADVPSPRLAPVEQIEAAAREKGLSIVEIDTPEQIVRRFRETSEPAASLLATGSHYVVGALPQELFTAPDDR